MTSCSSGYGETDADPGHTPWADFADSAADAQSFSAFPVTDAGFAALPAVSFITPSDADNMTDMVECREGLRQQLPADHRVHAESSRDDRVGAGIPTRVSNSQPSNGYGIEGAHGYHRRSE
jgi:hypothetical protein